MKKIYLIHCWAGKNTDGWYPWLKENIQSKDVEVIIPNMPNADKPSIKEWVDYLNNNIVLDKDTYFVGHSIGCQTIMRYLENKDIKVGGMLFIAPWFELILDDFTDEDKKIAAEWINTKIDFTKVKSSTGKIECIFSDNDYFVDIKNKEKFENLLNAKTILVHNEGHISSDDGINEEKTILEELKKMMGV